ncbi:MAG: hypothetical protein GX774_14960 [Armatimonadetes bacterium]|jgi:hypothetical protein|nr:hypothetical protein [Armatimonadota bacterium]
MSECAAVPGAAGPWADRGWYLVIEFEQSASERFERAVRIAATNPHFEVLIDEAGRCVYRVLYRAEELGSLWRLLKLVRGWKQTRCYVCGTEIAIDNLDYWLACYQQRSLRPPPACRRPLDRDHPARMVGCSYAGISLAPSDWNAWYHEGTLDATGVFHLDKARLRQRVDLWQTHYAACPFADAGILRRVVAVLPDQIDLHDNEYWDAGWHHRRGVVPTPRSQALYEKFLRQMLAPLLDEGDDRA